MARRFEQGISLGMRPHTISTHPVGTSILNKPCGSPNQCGPRDQTEFALLRRVVKCRYSGIIEDRECSQQISGKETVPMENRVILRVSQVIVDLTSQCIFNSDHSGDLGTARSGVSSSRLMGIGLIGDLGLA